MPHSVKTLSSVSGGGDFVVPPVTGFDEVLALIEATRSRVVTAVNTALIDLYWRIDNLANFAILHWRGTQPGDAQHDSPQLVGVEDPTGRAALNSKNHDSWGFSGT